MTILTMIRRSEMLIVVFFALKTYGVWTDHVDIGDQEHDAEQQRQREKRGFAAPLRRKEAGVRRSRR